MTTWLGVASDVIKAVPYVQRELDRVTWQMNALTDAPHGLTGEQAESLTRRLSEDRTIYQKALPALPSVDLHLVSASMAATSTTANIVYAIASEAEIGDNRVAVQWGTRHAAEYRQLQEQRGRDARVTQLLAALKSGLDTEFERANDEVRKYIAGASEGTAAAIAMRNVLEHYKGELFNLAPKKKSEQKLKWDQVAHRLFTDPPKAQAPFPDPTADPATVTVLACARPAPASRRAADASVGYTGTTPFPLATEEEASAASAVPSPAPGSGMFGKVSIRTYSACETEEGHGPDLLLLHEGHSPGRRSQSRQRTECQHLLRVH